METTDLLRKINITPERFPDSNNSKWVRIHMVNGRSCMGYYSYKDRLWREFNDILNLHNTSTINEKTIKGWHY